jgi:hypothetical protein
MEVTAEEVQKANGVVVNQGEQVSEIFSGKEEKTATKALPERVDLTDAEKYSLAKIENDWLKATAEYSRLQKAAEETQKAIQDAAKKFPETIKTLVDKYGISVDKYVYDNVSSAFVLKK